MPKCKECGENITKFDKEICPYCGCLNPIDKEREDTCDVTQAISMFTKVSDEKVKIKEHKRVTVIILSLLLGFLGIDAFYLGFKKEGILRIACNLSLASGLFLLFFFFVFDYQFLFPLIISLSILLISNILTTIFISLRRKKDANGAFLR